jgi:nitroreductase
MEFSQLIYTRYSVRAYKPDPVEEDKLTQVLEAARLAPTASNRQPFKLIVIPTAGREEELRKIYNKEWFVQAPYVICACAMPEQAWVRHADQENYYMVDIGIVFDHLVLEATELGLGTCWIAAFDPQAAREVLNLPPECVPVVFTPLGYADKQPLDKRRKPLDVLVERLDKVDTILREEP